MNEKQGTRRKANDRTVIYMCWGKISFLQCNDTRYINKSGQASFSGVADQDINKLHSVLCSFNLLQGLERVVFFFLVLLYFYF